MKRELEVTQMRGVSAEAGFEDAGVPLGRVAPTRVAQSVGDYLPPVIVFAAIFIAWQVLVETEIIPPILLPTPVDIVVEFWRTVTGVITGGFMLEHFLTTVQEIAVGFFGALTVGVALGTLISEFKMLRRIALPYVIGFNAAPKIAFAPVFLVWFGFGIWSKVVMAMSIAMFPILIGTIAGLNATGRDVERLVQAYGATRWQTFRKVRIYVALPYIFAGLETGVVLAVIGAIVGEFSGGSAGLGYVVVVAQESLNLEQAFAVILLLSLVGVVFHQAVVRLQRKLVYWHGRAPS